MTVPIPKMAGVCGWPIHQSLSPMMHNYWLKEMKIPGAYVHFAVRPDDAMHAFKTLKRTSIKGVNVTAPLKRIAFEAADIVTPDAEKLGVANCLFHRDGRLFAHNTDLEGFAAPLLNNLSPQAIMNMSALVIGTGGAARAVIGALLSLNCPEIRVCGRTDEKAEALVKEFSLPSLYKVSWNNRQTSLASADMVINASSAGMKHLPELDLDLKDARSRTFVYDLVYTPLKTGFLKQAKKRGLAHIGGLDMLVAQARPAFRIFFGETPPDDLNPMPLLKAALKKS